MPFRTTIATPVGEVTLEENGAALSGVWFGKKHTPGYEEKATPLLREAAKQLDEYFAGARKVFDLPLEPVGTSFQKTVWLALRAIPYGETRSYKEIAEAVGNPKGFRAVGLANGKNPLSIIVPCHRVIGSNGTLTGFGGGLPAKETLLALEKRNRA